MPRLEACLQSAEPGEQFRKKVPVEAGNVIGIDQIDGKPTFLVKGYGSVIQCVDKDVPAVPFLSNSFNAIEQF